RLRDSGRQTDRHRPDAGPARTIGGRARGDGRRLPRRERIVHRPQLVGRAVGTRRIFPAAVRVRPEPQALRVGLLDDSRAHPSVTRNEALALVQRLLNGARRGDLEVVRDCYAEDAVAISPAFGHVRGRDAILATWARLFSSADVAVEISTILVDG